MSSRPCVTGLILFLALICGGCQAVRDVLATAQRPSARIVGAQLAGLSLESATVRFDVRVDNPYEFALPLTNVQYSLAGGGQPFLTGAADLQGIVPARGSKQVTVPATVTFARLIEVLKDVKPGAVVPYDATLTLSATAPQVGTLALPLQKHGELPVPTVPQVELAEVHWQDIGLEKAEALLRLKVRNANQFPVDLSKLSLRLSLAGTDVASTQHSQPASFAAGAEQTLEIPVTISPKDLGLSALQFIRGSGGKYAIAGNLDLTTPFGPMSLPYEKTGVTSFR